MITDSQPGATGAISSAFLYYRLAGSGSAFTKIPLLGDPTDGSTLRYYADIPDTSVTLTGLEYYLEATNNVGKKRLVPATAPTTFRTLNITASVDTVAPLRLTPTGGNLNISAGFSRDLTIQAKRAGVNTFFNIAPQTKGYVFTPNASPPITLPVTKPVGYDIMNLIAPSTIRLTVGSTGAGTVTATSGSYSAVKIVTIHAGTMAGIVFLDNAGVLLNDPVTVAPGNTFQFDVIGRWSCFYSDTIIWMVPGKMYELIWRR